MATPPQDVMKRRKELEERERLEREKEEARKRELEQRALELMRKEVDEAAREVTERETFIFLRGRGPEEREEYLSALSPDMAARIRKKLHEAEGGEQKRVVEPNLVRLPSGEAGDISWTCLPQRVKEAMLHSIWPDIEVGTAGARLARLRKAFIQKMTELAERGELNDPAKRREALAEMVKRLKSEKI